MKNFIQDGNVLDAVIAAGGSSGDPIMVGKIKGVLATDVTSGGTGQIKTSGVFDLSVKGVNDSGNIAVSIGDEIYYTSSDTPVLNKKTSGKFFGIALEGILSGATDTIKVQVCPGGAPADVGADAVGNSEIQDDAVSLEHLDSGITPSHIVVAAGEFTTAGGDAAETITVSGCLVTDIAIVTVKTAGSTPRSIVAAAAASGQIDVTMSDNPSTDHVLAYMVLRAAA